jgi:hypothetical protein
MTAAVAMFATPSSRLLGLLGRLWQLACLLRRAARGSALLLLPDLFFLLRLFGAVSFGASKPIIGPVWHFAAPP